MSFSVAAGQCAIAGQSAGFTRYYRLLSNAGIYTATAIGTLLQTALTIAVGFGTLTTSGQSATWSSATRFSVESGIMACDRKTAGLYRALRLQAEARTVNLAGQLALHSIASASRANSRQLGISIGL